MPAWQPLTRQIPELVLVHGATALPMGVALIQRQARLRQFLGWPFVALLAAVAGAFAWWFIRNSSAKHQSPDESEPDEKARRRPQSVV